MSRDLGLAAVRTRIREHSPKLLRADPPPTLEASVALILHQDPSIRHPELLFIRRAEREGDPWSGHMAFPGGRRQHEDENLTATALRETHEEVGFRPSRVLGRLDDFTSDRSPRTPDLRVAGVVCEVSERPALALNHEVQSAVWIPLPWILDPRSIARFESPASGGSFPAFEYEGYVVWGMTYRILRSFFAVLGAELPEEAAR